MDQLASMRIFVKVVDLGGLTPVAEAERMSATMVGKHLRQLEERLGVRLLNRTTRRQSLTEAGQLYYERCKHALAEVAAADASVSSMASAPRGLLRVSAAMLFGIHALTPVVNDYLARYPQMRVELHLNDRIVDLIDENMDAAIRVGKLPDSSLAARPLRPYRLIVCAAPAYLQAHGAPTAPDELRAHNCISFLGVWSQDAWSFTLDGAERHVGVDGNFKVNSVHALRSAALQGLGIAFIPETMIGDDLASGALVELLADYAAPVRPLNIVYPSTRLVTPKLRTFIDCVVEHLG
ncbi:LysR family transcriptional regulator [Massilia arenosa]|uniref:LysR family transcriptional regulator n=1 Tax=Zemynaea arenosa TaxID=2561931 RepID=A0A4Y9SI18_9BURK|nr:LysR family transcriptional regulator [Massilia arenosa]TFW21261.1 LysR family transcriptional regulator [Massilia arenosa]